MNMRNLIDLMEDATQEDSESPAENCFNAIEQAITGMPITTDINVKNDTTIDIGWIGAVNPGAGQGTKAMKIVLGMADRYGVTLTLEVADDEMPDDEDSEGVFDDGSDSHINEFMNADQLVSWYGSMGFEYVGHDGWRAQMMRKPLMSEDQHLNELNVSAIRSALRLEFEDVDEFTEWMHEQGYEKLGRGNYGVVFSHEKLPYALKVFRQDGGYERFINYVLANSNNPHLPKIKRPINVPGKVTVIAVENLIPLQQSPEYFDDFIYVLDTKSFAPNHMRKFAEEFERKNPSLAETIKDIYANRPSGCVSDLHTDNLMQRQDGTLVVTDPWCV